MKKIVTDRIDRRHVGELSEGERFVLIGGDNQVIAQVEAVDSQRDTNSEDSS